MLFSYSVFVCSCMFNLLDYKMSHFMTQEILFVYKKTLLVINEILKESNCHSKAVILSSD